MINLRTISISLLLLAASAPGGGKAQNGPNLGTLRDVAITGNTPSAEPGPVVDDGSLIPFMEGDEEFGELLVIERASNWYPFSINASIGGFGTNNAELATSGGTDDKYLRSIFDLSYTPLIKGNLFADLGVSEEMYRYDNLRALDFDYQRTRAGAYYYIPDLDSGLGAWIENGFLFANYSWYRVSDRLFGDSVFQNHSAVFGFQKAIPIKKGHQVFYGISSDLSFDASNAIFQRDEYRIYGGYSVRWTEDFLTQANYVASWFDYHVGTQNDWNHVVEILASWVAARPVLFGVEGELYLQGNVSFTLNDSSFSNQDYEYFIWGGSLGYTTSF